MLKNETEEQKIDGNPCNGRIVAPFFVWNCYSITWVKICPRLYRINEDVNFMKRSAKCRPVQFRSNLFECQNRYYFFFFFSSLDTTTTSMHFLLSCYISLFRIIRIDPVVASYLNLISYFFSTSVNDAAPTRSDSRVAVCPSYGIKINLIPQFRLLVHARCVNAAMLVEMYILFETRDPVVSLLFKYVNHGSATRVPHPKTAILDPFFSPPFPYEASLLNI